MKMKADLRVMHPHAQESQHRQQSAGSWERSGEQMYRPQPSEGTSSANTLILASWPSGLQDREPINTCGLSYSVSGTLPQQS